MSYALVIDGVLKQYPYGFGDLRRDNPQVSFPEEMTEEAWAEHGGLAVAATEPPAVDGKVAVEGQPELVDGRWQQSWTLADAPRRRIAKAIIIARLDEGGKLGAAMAALKADDVAFARWISPVPDIFADDAAAIALLTAIGADVTAILAP